MILNTQFNGPFFGLEGALQAKIELQIDLTFSVLTIAIAEELFRNSFFHCFKSSLAGGENGEQRDFLAARMSKNASPFKRTNLIGQ